MTAKIMVSSPVVHQPLTVREKELTGQIVDIAIKIHKVLGPGLLETIYEKCFCYELKKRGIAYQRQADIKITYDGVLLDEGLRVDLVVDNRIIIEIKTREDYHPVWEAQLLSYLRLTGKRLGYILNFHVPLMKDGIRRMIL